MTKAELFKKYSIDESHKQWETDLDNWKSVEVYRLMHNGQLPSSENTSVKWITDFLDKSDSDMKWWAEKVMSRPDWGSLYLTAKRMVYRLHEQILEQCQ